MKPTELPPGLRRNRYGFPLGLAEQPLNGMKAAQSVSQAAPKNVVEVVNTFSFVRKGKGITVEIVRMSLPSEEIFEQLLQIWNEPWSFGIPSEGKETEMLRQELLINRDQLESMHKFSWKNILLARDAESKKIIGAIWGTQKDVALRKYPSEGDLAQIRNYTQTTDFLTFDNCDPFGRMRACVSVAVLDEYRGFLSQEEDKSQKISIGQALVRSSLIETLISPYQTDIIAYSRPFSLCRFVELIWGLREKQGIRVFHDPEQNVWCYHSSRGRGKVEITSKGIEIDGKLYPPGDEFSGRIVYSGGRYYLEPGSEQLIMDEIGVAVRGENAYLVKLEPYLETDFDGMKRFHGNKGGKVRWVFYGSRPDRVSLNYNVAFYFSMGGILKQLDLFSEIAKRLSPLQQKAISWIVKYPGRMRKVLDQRASDPKDIFFGFSREKIEYLMKFAKKPENYAILRELIRELELPHG